MTHSLGTMPAAMKRDEQAHGPAAHIANSCARTVRARYRDGYRDARGTRGDRRDFAAINRAIMAALPDASVGLHQP
jgi:hypothetical protein